MLYVSITASHFIQKGTSEKSLTSHSTHCRGVTKYVQHRKSYTGCSSCTESNSRWHWWSSQSTHAAAQTTSPIQCRRVTVIRDGLDSTRRPVLTILFHGQERSLATEPSLWPDQLYGSVYRQQFVKQTACIRLSASSKLIFLGRPERQFPDGLIFCRRCFFLFRHVFSELPRPIAWNFTTWSESDWIL